MNAEQGRVSPSIATASLWGAASLMTDVEAPNVAGRCKNEFGGKVLAGVHQAFDRHFAMRSAPAFRCP